MVAAEFMPAKSPVTVRVFPLRVRITSPSPVIVVTVCGVVGIGESLARKVSDCATALTEKINASVQVMDVTSMEKVLWPSFIVTSWRVYFYRASASS
jgi:hypothetical protein